VANEQEPKRAPEPTAGRPRMVEGYGIAKTESGMLAWNDVRERLAAARNYWVATTRANGRPHVMPVWGLWWDETFYFSTDATSQKGRNLAANPEVVVHLESGDDVVIIEGRAARISDEPTLTEFANRYDAKYQFRPDTSNPAFAFFLVRPSRVFAWREADFPTSATRWVLRRD
jgi:PPOX class probable F420-dependent enzyme